MQYRKIVACILIFVLFFNTVSWAITINVNNKETAKDFDTFLNNCNSGEREALMKSIKEDASSFEVQDIKKELVWVSSHWVTYKFKDTENVYYHDIVKWLAGKFDVDSNQIENSSTFYLEQLILCKIFDYYWINLSEEEKNKILDEVGIKEQEQRNVAKKCGMAHLLAAKMVKDAGFKPYIFIVKVISKIGKILGIKIPPEIFSNATWLLKRIISLANDPRVKIIFALIAAANIGAPNIEKTARFVLTANMIKTSWIESEQKNSESDFYIGLLLIIIFCLVILSRKQAKKKETKTLNNGQEANNVEVSGEIQTSISGKTEKKAEIGCFRAILYVFVCVFAVIIILWIIGEML